MEYVIIDSAAFGDLRKGHGSLGITPPEAIVEKYMPCRPDQDVFAVGHLILLIVTKRRYKNYNMFLSRVGALSVLSRYRIHVRLIRGMGGSGGGWRAAKRYL